jgi:hypothetical protein
MSPIKPINQSTPYNNITNANRINIQIEKSISIKNSVIIQISDILNAPSDEEWTNSILLAMIHNLAFDMSALGQFGTPDSDIRNTVINSGSGKNTWVKLLGIRMKILILQLDDLDLSSTHKERIRQLDYEFKQIFPSRLPHGSRPYATLP